MLRGLLVILLFQCLGEAIKLASGTLLPGPVIGLLLLFATLLLTGGPSPGLEASSGKLIGLLALLLMPPSVGLFFLGERLQGQWPALLAAVLLGTLATLLASALTMQWLLRRQTRNDGHES